MNRSGIVLLCLGFLCLGLSAQQITGNIRGTVTDPSGAVIRGAAVTARQAETGLSRVTTATIETVITFFWNCRSDTTACRPRRRDSRQYVQDGITLNVNETAAVSPRLLVGSENQQVDSERRCRAD